MTPLLPSAGAQAYYINGITIEVGADAEARILDEELGRWLGYKRPADIRELIGRWENELGDIIRTVRKTSPLGGRPAEETWLTERQALFVCTKSETSRATEVTLALVDACLEARKRWRASAPPPLMNTAQALLQAVTLLAKHEEQIARHEAGLVRAEERLLHLEKVTAPDPRITAIAYSKIYRLPSHTNLSKLGWFAVQVGRNWGRDCDVLFNRKFGKVNAWDPDVWHEAYGKLKRWEKDGGDR